jgi:hypothetical protein
MTSERAHGDVKFAELVQQFVEALERLRGLAGRSSSSGAAARSQASTRARPAALGCRQ